MFNFHVYICQEYLKVKSDVDLVLLTILLHKLFEYRFIFHSSIRYKSEDF